MTDTRTPPSGWNTVSLKECEHKFVYLREEREYSEDELKNRSGLPAVGKRIDVFYCEKCLAYQRIR